MPDQSKGLRAETCKPSLYGCAAGLVGEADSNVDDYESRL